MSTYTSAAQNAATIRAALKKHYGITSRQVSVRSSTFSMGSSVDVSIHDPAVDIREVKNIADKFEKIDRCEITGEILCGGNRHLSVSYSDKARDAFAAANVAKIDELVSEIPPVNSSHGGKEVDRMCIFREYGNGHTLELVHLDTNQRAWIGDASTKHIAAAMLALRSGPRW